MKDIKEPILILVILLLAFGLLYSPLTKLKKQRLLESTNSSAIGEAKTYSPNQNVWQEIKNTELETKKLSEKIKEENEKKLRSLYFGKIRMSNISGLYETNPDNQYLSLTTILEADEKVKISGWYLKSEFTGYTVVIGKAALLPFPFTQILSDVVLQQNDRVFLTKGFSPIGISFRTNKCTGYFEQDRTFVPSLQLMCPWPEDEVLPIFSSSADANDACLDAIKRVSHCQTVDNSFINSLPENVTTSCKDYLQEQINYNTCVSKHFSDTDFPGQEYRLYFKKFGPLWNKTHDKINLYDENNLIVDTVSW